jgi:hypothetical protein
MEETNSNISPYTYLLLLLHNEKLLPRERRESQEIL